METDWRMSVYRDEVDCDRSKRKQSIAEELEANELSAQGGPSMRRQKITSIFLIMALVKSVFALPTVTVRRKSPEFTIADSTGKTTQLSSFKNKGSGNADQCERQIHG